MVPTARGLATAAGTAVELIPRLMAPQYRASTVSALEVEAVTNTLAVVESEEAGVTASSVLMHIRSKRKSLYYLP